MRALIRPFRQEVFDCVGAANHHTFWRNECGPGPAISRRGAEREGCAAICKRLLQFLKYIRTFLCSFRRGTLSIKEWGVPNIVQYPQIPSPSVRQDRGARKPLVAFAVRRKLDLVSVKHADLFKFISFARYE